MIARIVVSVLVGVVVYLLAVLLLPLLTLPTDPWATLLGVLVALVVFFNGRL